MWYFTLSIILPYNFFVHSLTNQCNARFRCLMEYGILSCMQYSVCQRNWWFIHPQSHHHHWLRSAPKEVKHVGMGVFQPPVGSYLKNQSLHEHMVLLIDFLWEALHVIARHMAFEMFQVFGLLWLSTEQQVAVSHSCPRSSGCRVRFSDMNFPFYWSWITFFVLFYRRLQIIPLWCDSAWQESISQTVFCSDSVI